MYRTRRSESLLLLFGDIVALALSFPIALALRYFELPTKEFVVSLLPAFIVVHILWILGFYIFDLYSRQTVAFRRRILAVLLRAQSLNVVMGIILFYIVPSFGISPKTILLIDGVVVAVLVLLWRIFLLPRLYRSKPLRTVAIGAGKEFEQLRRELKDNPKFNFEILGSTAGELGVVRPDVVIIDSRDETVSKEVLAKHVTRGGQVIDASMLYEDIFDRIPLTLVGDSWFLANITGRTHRMHDISKRLMDIVISLVLIVFSLIIMPFVALAIVLESGRPVFIRQERIGLFGELVSVYKYRSMTGDDAGKYSGGKTSLKVTKVGKFMRKARIDELPQLFSVLTGKISLIGPRYELPALAKTYKEEIPYYDLRHIIKPGLSGWAQIYHKEHPHHGEAVQQTRDKLSYDLYYVKNRSFTLDLKIALKTIKTLLFFEGA